MKNKLILTLATSALLCGLGGTAEADKNYCEKIFDDLTAHCEKYTKDREGWAYSPWGACHFTIGYLADTSWCGNVNTHPNTQLTTSKLCDQFNGLVVASCNESYGAKEHNKFQNICIDSAKYIDNKCNSYVGQE